MHVHSSFLGDPVSDLLSHMLCRLCCSTVLLNIIWHNLSLLDHPKYIRRRTKNLCIQHYSFFLKGHTTLLLKSEMK